MSISQKAYTRNQTRQSHSGLVSIRGRPNWIFSPKGCAAKAGRWWACSFEETIKKRTTFRESGCLIAPERWKKGTGSSCQPSSPAPYTSPCLGSTRTSGFPGSREAAALLTSSFGKKQMENADLAVLEHCCWALLLQFTENQSCNKILPEGSKSLQLFVFHVVILNCSKLSFPCESCATMLPLCFHACTGWSREVSLLGTSSGDSHPISGSTSPAGPLSLDTSTPVVCTSRHPCPRPPRGITAKPMGLIGGCSSWDLPTSGKWGGSALPHCGSTHLPSGRTGV